MQEVSSLQTPSLKLNKKSIKEVLLFPAIAALISILCFVVMCLVSEKYPLGKYTVVVSDLEAQYAPYLFLLKSKLINLDFGNLVSNFGYSFLLGAGKNFAGTYGYYLASPLNLLVLFFHPTQINELVLLLMGIRTSLAAAFMCAFIRERATDKTSRWPILWGVMYAFSSYMMLFLFQIMWLDGYLLLPLLLLFIERYIKNRKLGGITVVLLLLFLSNYYIAYMAGIYSFIYLLARMYVEGLFTRENKPLNMIGRFILRAVLCGLSLGVMLLPVGLDTISNADPTNIEAESSYVSFTAVKFLDRIFLGYPGDFAEVLISNMPLIFVSLLVTVLCTVYLVSKVFTGKEKKLYVAAFILIYLTLCINALDVAWQVFDSPNWFWHRESFVFITFFMVVSYKTFEKLEEITTNEILKAGGILAVLLLIAQSLGEMKGHGKIFVYNIVFLAAIVLILVLMKKKDWSGQLKDMGKLLPKFLAIIIVFETSFLAPLLSSGTATMSVFYSEIDEYKDSIFTFLDCAQASRDINNGFRSEYEALTYENDIGLGGASQYAEFRGLSLFNSNSNKHFGRFLKQLGYRVNYNYFASSHSYSSPDSDAFFSIGTLYCSDDYSAATFIAEDDNVRFYRNENVLPLAFAVDRGALDFDFYSLETATTTKNYFEFRNDWYSSLFGSFNEDYFITQEDGIEINPINCETFNLNDYITADVESNSIQVEDDEEEDKPPFDPDDLGLEVVSNCQDSITTYYQMNSKSAMVINYNIEIQSEDELYLNISAPRIMSECYVYVNGTLVSYNSPYTYYSEIIRLGSFDVGDVINVSLSSDAESISFMEVNFAYFDLDTFEEQFAGIDTHKVDVVEASDGYVNLSANISNDELILTTIPYEDGWVCYVDGVETPITPYAESLIAIDVEAGSHDITLKFTPPGFKAGLLISVVGIVGLIAVSVIDTKKKNCDNIAVKKK